MAHVSSLLEGPTAVLTFENPPVNGLSLAVRTELVAALREAFANPEVKSIVLAGGGGLFSGGADIRELGTPAATTDPTLRTLIDLVENGPKPVIAAIAGTCLGGGLELALAAHHRVAVADARLGLPEVKLGLIPGAGGTQRLPRLAGTRVALDLIVRGEPVTAGSLAASGLLDRVVERDPAAAAVELAGSVVERPPRRSGELPVGGDLLPLCQAERGRLLDQPTRVPAPLKAVDAIEAAARPLSEGLAFERQLFLELMQSPESRGLRHAFFAERAAGKVPGLDPNTPTRPIERVAVIGAGTMGAGISVALLDAGLPVSLVETDRSALDRGRERVAAIYQAQVDKGKLAAAERDRRLTRLQPTLALQDLAPADLVIEAVFESMDLKQSLFTALDRILKPGTILASNTSSLDLNLLAGFTRRPQDVVGLHFFSPANVMRLLEVVRGERTAPDVLATALKLGKTLRKVAVVSGVCDGFIGNRMLMSYVNQAWYLVEGGASPLQVDRAIEDFGVAMGPFRVADLVGNDVSWAIRKRRRAELPGFRASTLPDRLCELGRFGQKTGAGWYDYPEGPRHPRPSPVVEELVSRQRTGLGITPRAIDVAEIVDRLVYALVNEGARILEEGIAARASDIDVVYLTGYGFPAFRGGPMFYADEVGLRRVRERILEFGRDRHGEAGFWIPAPLLDRLAEAGLRFNA